MCGLFGWQFTEDGLRGEGSLVSLATSLIQANELRGKDSWGFARLEADGSIKVIKSTGYITMRIHLKSILHAQVLGHTRLASSGKVTTENAHPFTINGLIGAHNGSVTNESTLDEKHGWKYPVDSQYLLRYIADSLPLNEVCGYGVVEYIYSNEPGTVHLAIGQSGDLAIAGIGRSKQDTVGIVWSSRHTDLERALELSGYKYFLFSQKSSKQFKVTNGKLIKNGRFELEAWHVSAATPYRSSNASYTHDGRTIYCRWPDGKELEGLPHTLSYYRTGYYWSLTRGLYIRHDLWDENRDGRQEKVSPPRTALTLQGDEREEQCEGCLEWGMPVEPPDLDGIRMYPTIGRKLCGDCGSVWGQEVGGGTC